MCLSGPFVLLSRCLLSPVTIPISLVATPISPVVNLIGPIVTPLSCSPISRLVGPPRRPVILPSLLREQSVGPFVLVGAAVAPAKRRVGQFVYY